MSNSLDSFLTRIGDVTIERVAPRGSPRGSDQGGGSDGTEEKISASNPEIHARNDEDSDETGGETSDGELEKKMEILQAEEMHSEGSGDDMDLDDTIDTEIGVRMDPIDRQRSESSCPDDDEGVNILDTLPLEGAPIEGQEVSEADLLGKPLSKDDDGESIDGSAQLECNSHDEDDQDGCKRHAEDDDSDSVKKKQKKEDSNEECETKSEKKLANMRRNIREVMDETQLDEATLSAQRQEMERLRRVQEQQRIIREVQRQIAINRQNNKTQTRVISLLQGKQNDIGTTLSQTSSSSSSQVKMPGTTMLKVNNAAQGAQSPSSGHLQQPSRRPNDGMRWQKGRGGYPPVQTSISRLPGRPPLNQNILQQRIRMMTPSVSISPVVPKKEPSDRLDYDSDSDISEADHEEMIDDNDLHKIPSLIKLPKPPKGKDVVTISSSSDDSDDDCIVLSDPSGGEETDTEDDPANSGMHTNDRYNVPDEHGRVLINVGHPDGEPDVYLAPQISRIIKPHQIGGIRFLFDNIVESIDRYKNSSGFGCILAHSMGLGKTLQVASFCDIFFRCTTAKTVLCIMPINTLQNWLAEFNMWLPYEDPDSVKPETSSTSSSSFSSQKNGNVMDSKTEIKEENSNLTDVSSSMSSSAESANRSGQDIPGMMTGNPFGQQAYDSQTIPYNYQENMMKPNVNQNPNFNQRYPGNIPHNPMYGYPQMKQEMELTEMPKNIPGPLGYGNEGPIPQNPGNIYGSTDNHQQGQIYPSSENHGSMYPPIGNQDSHGNYHGYQQIPPPLQSYQNYPPSIPQQLQKSEDSQNSAFNIKKEPEEFGTKDEGTSMGKEESSEEKKDAAKVKTPFCVDAPIGVEIRPRHFKLHILNDSHKTMAARARVIKDWQKNGGVLLIGYELYRQLSLKKPNKAKRKRGQAFNKDTVDVEEEDKNKGFLDEMHGALVNPGPDLVICDEGHRIKNSHASISLALKQMRTKRRIVLTGYPLQNNLLEYWCMVDFVRPNYLGTKSEFCNMFERPIQNGQCIDSTPQDIRLMRYRAHVLHALLEGFVQRRSHSVLQISLPRKEEYILLVRMTPHQRKLYDTFMNQVVKTRAVPNPLKAFAVCCKIWNHPDILYHFLKKRQTNEEDDLDLEETIAEKSATGNKRGKAKATKGESKKGRKVNATVKNKPAASIPPNSSISISNGDGDSENIPESKPGNFGNHSQVQNSNFSSTNTNNYQQNFSDFQGNDQRGNFYRNDSNSGEFNEFYGVQGGQRYTNQSGSFQNFPQGSSNYGNTSQNYSQQSQNQVYQGNEGNTDNSQKYPQVNSGNSDFPNDQSSSNNYEVPGMFPRQQYGFQDQSGNYPNVNQRVNQQYQQNMNQQTNYPNQISNQSTAPIAEYSGYNEQQNNSNYSSQTPSRSGQMYSQNQPNSQGCLQPSGYLPNQPPPSQQNSSAMLPSSYPQNQQNQNQSHNYQNQMTNNDSGSSIPANSQLYPNNQNNQEPMVQNGSQTYIRNQQNSMGNYSSPQNQNITPQSQNMRPQGQGNYQNNQTTPGITIKQEYPGNHLLPGSAQDPSYPPSQNTNTGAQNYQQNSQVPIVQGQSQGHRYSGAPQGNLPNQSVNYPPGQQSQNDEQNRGQTTMANYSGDSQWQGNYSQQIPTDQVTDQYYREQQNSNRYQNNYFPGQNYQQNSYTNEYSTGTETIIKTEDRKPAHLGMLSRNQNPQVQFDKKDANLGIQNQQIPPGQNYNNPNESNIPNIPNAPNISNQSRSLQNMPACLGFNNRVNQTDKDQQELEKKNKDEVLPEKEKDDKSDDEVLIKEEEKDCKNSPGGKEDPGIPYDWATDLMKGYVPGLIDASAKMSMFFCILEEAIKLGDRVLTFSQSLFTLNLIEDFLARNDFKYRDGQTESWVKNINYYRLDGSTSALEREKLINEFNHNPKIHLFLVSTRAGSLGINLVGANRAIVFDASWNPCHDTQAVCRVYRYGQQKPCYVYRLVTDNCLERKIYDRQISKQGMADRVVDQCNPDAHLSLKEATTLSWDWEEDSQVQDFSSSKDTYTDEVMHSLLERYSSMLTKQPFHHESLLVDRKDKKLSQAEKRLARRGYELEKMAATSSRPSYNYIPGNTATRAGGLQIRAIRGGGSGGGGGGGGDQGVAPKPVASVRPMQQRGAEGLNARGIVGSRWIPAEVWQRQGMSAQEMTLPLDVVIPTNSPDKSSIVLKAGQRVMVLKSPKGIYMQLESGKIIAIRTALKLNQQKREEEPKKGSTSVSPRAQNPKPDVGFPLRNNSAISIIPKVPTNTVSTPRPLSRPSSGSGYRQFPEKDVGKRPKPVLPSPILKPMGNQMNLTGQVSLQKIFKGKHDSMDHSSAGENSNSSDSQPRTDQRVEEVRLEDVVAEASSHPEYSPSNSRVSNPESDPNLRRVDDDKSRDFNIDQLSGGKIVGQNIQNQHNSELEHSEKQHRLMSSQMKDEIRSVQSGSYSHVESYGHSAPPPKVNNDEIILEEPSGQSSMSMQQPSPMIPLHSNMQQDLNRSRTTVNQTHTQLSQEMPKSHPESSNSRTSSISTTGGVHLGTNPPINKDRPVEIQEINPSDPHSLPQGYPYTQYPRYYDYADPRSRNLTPPYGSYYPSGQPTGQRQQEGAKELQRQPVENPKEERITLPTAPTAYHQVPQISAPPPASVQQSLETNEQKNSEQTEQPAQPTILNANRSDTQVPTAFSHPPSSRYPTNYPSTYDPYSQHYPSTPGSPASYTPSGTPGYAGYGGPGYNTEYARMYSAFHGPPPVADPYMHRGYAPPPSTHPTNYYAPFPHPPPPPYPNYSFLPTYSNPNVPSESQPPAQ